MKRQMSIFMATLLLCFFVLSQGAMAFEIPDFGKIAEEAGSEIVDAAGNAGDTISDVVGEAEEMASDIVGTVGDAAGQVSYIASGFASMAGEVLSEWGKYAGETADVVKEELTDAGVTIIVSAEELGNATAQKASELTETAGKTADDAIEAVSDAGEYVVDQAGHVVNLADIAADYVSSEATEAIEVLQKHGSLLMNLAENAVADIDLSGPQTWEVAQTAVDDAVNKAYEDGFIDREKISEETMRTVTSIVFGTLMYGYQYQNGIITLGEYTALMSEVLIREGVPAGVGFIVSLLPISKIPHAESMAKEATYYLISVAYGDKSGDEIKGEEESLLNEVIETATND